MQLRLTQDMHLGLGKEASWASTPTMFRPLSVLQQSLAEMPVRRRRQELGCGQFATKSQLIHTHIGGEISWQAAFGQGEEIIASVVAGSWHKQQISGLITALPSAKLSRLTSDEQQNPHKVPSFGLVRHFDARDGWQHFQGLQTSRLRITIGAGGEAVINAAVIGKMVATAHSTVTRYANAMPVAVSNPPFNLNLAPSVVAIQTLGKVSRILQSTGDFALSQITITMTRGGMTPLFGLSTMPPIGIADGLLASEGAVHLLYTPSLADILHENARLKLQITMYDKSGHALVILLPNVLVTNSDVETSSPTMPPMLKIGFESQKQAAIPLVVVGVAEWETR